MEHNDDKKITVRGWITILFIIGFFCTIVWSQVQSGTPLWWAPVVAFTFMGCGIAISKLDNKGFIVFLILCIAALVVEYAMR